MKFFDHEIRIRYAETDQMGVSYYANYFVWFEAARADMFRNLEIPYTEYEKQGTFLPVADAYCKYFAPSRYDELIFVRTSVSQLKITSMKFSYQVLNDTKDRILAWGWTTHVFTDAEQKPKRVPEEVKERIEIFSLPEKELVAT